MVRRHRTRCSSSPLDNVGGGFGDFAVEEDELQSVLIALRRSNINVVAIHHHMIGESPRMLFLHFWAMGPAQQLARGVKSGIEAQSVPRPLPEARTGTDDPADR